ncbi:hypothetical protein NQ317_010040 [Molorchus minor]|uniref:DNA-PKcs N-terminal domain-containing protein n=1 Tax=Molorchus minor TaxID=1323400 RepID=A0ABQ9J6J8_9CUCU|nr:hypothetical protein NQ317_010040 [Molorchus minor]
MVQYKDELLISCLQVLLECPVVVIQDMLPACITPFLTIFSVGRSFLPLAEMGLNTLEYWQDNINSNDFELLLTKVVPSLDSYLKSKSLKGQASKNIAEKRRKTVQALKKRRVLLELEPELNIMAIYHCIEKIFTLKITLPYDDLHLDIHLDSLVMRVINLALYCSDRKTRITACELLQGIVIVFLGRAKPMSQSGLSGVRWLTENNGNAFASAWL